MEFLEISKNEYETYFYNSNQANFWQSLEMAAMREQKGWTIHYVGVKEQGELLGACVLHSMPVYRKYTLFMALRGFLLDYHNKPVLCFFLQELKAYLDAHHCMYMKLDPYIPYQAHNLDGDVIEGSQKEDDIITLLEEFGFTHQGFRTWHDDDFEPRWMSVLPLEDKNETEILKDMHVRTRQNINNTIKTGIKVRELQRNELSILEKIVDDTGNRRNFNKPDLAYYEHFYDAFKEHAKAIYAYLDMDDYQARIQSELDEELANKRRIEEALSANPESKKNEKRLRMVQDLIDALEKRKVEADELASANGKEIALGAALFVIYPTEVVYLFSGSNDEFKKFKGPYAIQWYMIQYALQHQIKRYNFYGISGNFHEDADDYGVYLFKKGFHADVVELLGDFIYIANPSAYKQYQALRKIKHKVLKR